MSDIVEEAVEESDGIKQAVENTDNIGLDEVNESTTIELLTQSIKKTRWNFMLSLGIALLMLAFVLFPMPVKIDYQELNGTAEKDIGFIWGPSPSGEDIIDSSFEITVEIIQLPTTSRNITLEAFVLKIDDCLDSSISEIQITAREATNHNYQYAMIDSPVEGETYKFDFSLDMGQYCLSVKLVDEQKEVVDPGSTKLQVSGKLWPNRVIGGIPGLILLSVSIMMYVKTRNLSKELSLLIGDEEESSISTVGRKSKPAGHSGPPKQVAGPSGPPKGVVSGPSGPPKRETTTASSSGLNESIQQSIEPEPSIIVESTFEDAGNGYYYRKMADGSYEQVIYVINNEGEYVPYEA